MLSLHLGYIGKYKFLCVKKIKIINILLSNCMKNENIVRGTTKLIDEIEKKKTDNWISTSFLEPGR